MRRITCLSEDCLTQPYFISLSHKRQNSRGKKILNMKRVFWFSLHVFVCVISHSKEFSNKRVNQTCYRPAVATSASYNMNWLVFITEMESVYCAVRTGSLNKAVCSLSFKVNNCIFCLRVYAFCIYLRTNSDLCHLQNKLIGFYNPDEKCLQRGTDWVFK